MEKNNEHENGSQLPKYWARSQSKSLKPPNVQKFVWMVSKFHPPVWMTKWFSLSSFDSFLFSRPAKHRFQKNQHFFSWTFFYRKSCSHLEKTCCKCSCFKTEPRDMKKKILDVTSILATKWQQKNNQKRLLATLSIFQRWTQQRSKWDLQKGLFLLLLMEEIWLSTWHVWKQLLMR